MNLCFVSLEDLLQRGPEDRHEDRQVADVHLANRPTGTELYEIHSMNLTAAAQPKPSHRRFSCENQNCIKNSVAFFYKNYHCLAYLLW